MSDDNSLSFDFSGPPGRQLALAKIPPDRVKARVFHGQLLDIFRREMNFRRTKEGTPEAADYFESLYHCALLLYLVGDLTDVPLMWEAKHLNFDTSCGFDGQFLVGAGVEETIRSLETSGHKEIADYVSQMKDAGDFDDLPGWERQRIRYFYSE